MTKKVLCSLAIVVSTVVVLALCVRLLDSRNPYMLSMYVIAPVIFSLPWFVIMQGDD